MSVSNYIKKLLLRLGHMPKTQHSPHQCIPVQRSMHNQRQLATQDDDSPLLAKEKIRNVQSIVGSILHCGRPVDHATLPPLNTTSWQ